MILDLVGHHQISTKMIRVNKLITGFEIGMRISPNSIKYKAVQITDDIPSSSSFQSHVSSSQASNMGLNSYSNGIVRPPGSLPEIRTTIPYRPMMPTHVVRWHSRPAQDHLDASFRIWIIQRKLHPPLQDPTCSRGHQYLQQSNLVPRPPYSVSNVPVASVHPVPMFTVQEMFARK